MVYVALGMALLGMLMTGSRGPVFLLAILFPLYWWLAVMRGADSGATFARLVVGLTMLLVLVATVGADAVQAFRGRMAGSQDLQSRFVTPITSAFEILPRVGPLGFGIGATHQTASAVTAGVVPYSWLHGLEVEAETGRIMIELGPVGFFLVYFVRIYLIVFALRQVLTLRTTFHRALATGSLMFFLAQILGSIVFDITADLYFWFLAGLLFLVMRLDRQAAVQAPSGAVARNAEPPPRTELVPAAAGGRTGGD
jgi:hypothetical protein